MFSGNANTAISATSNVTAMVVVNTALLSLQTTRLLDTKSLTKTSDRSVFGTCSKERKKRREKTLLTNGGITSLVFTLIVTT